MRPGGDNRRCDRHTDLKIENVWVDSQMVAEPGPGSSDALGGDSSHQLVAPGIHYAADLRSRNGDANDGGLLGGGPYDLWCVEHDGYPLWERILVSENGGQGRPPHWNRALISRRAPTP